MSFYIIKSSLSGLVLDIEGCGKAGTKVIPFDRHGKDNQVWYDNPSQGTICSKAGNYCLAVTNNQLCVEDYHSGKASQQWMRDGLFIINRVDHNKVLDVYDQKKEKGAKIGDYAFNGGTNQKWEFEVVPGQPPVSGQAAPMSQASTYPAYPGYPSSGTGGGSRREFHIVSKMHGKVVDIVKGKAEAGTKIVMWSKHKPASKNQLWYMDEQGHIRSALNNMIFTSPKNGEILKMQPAGGDSRSQWFFQGEKITNRSGDGLGLDIVGASDDNGAELCAYEFKNHKNQQWVQEYV